jgi:hypothetical protein
MLRMLADDMLSIKGDDDEHLPRMDKEKPPIRRSRDDIFAPGRHPVSDMEKSTHP